MKTYLNIETCVIKMKQHPDHGLTALATAVLPKNLLRMQRPLPIETHGLGQIIHGGMRIVAPEGCTPRRSTAGAAGHVLFSPSPAFIPAGGSVIIDTQLAVQLPIQHFGKIEGISELGVLHDIVPFGGIIDEDYRGPIKVKLFNFSKQHYHIKFGDRIAQMIIQQYSAPNIYRTSSLNTTERNFGGFGSSGR
jgi:dUTP pyrophosphatase